MDFWAWRDGEKCGMRFGDRGADFCRRLVVAYLVVALRGVWVDTLNLFSFFPSPILLPYRDSA